MSETRLFPPGEKIVCMVRGEGCMVVYPAVWAEDNTV